MLQYAQGGSPKDAPMRESITTQEYTFTDSGPSSNQQIQENESAISVSDTQLKLCQAAGHLREIFASSFCTGTCVTTRWSPAYGSL